MASIGQLIVVTGPMYATKSQSTRTLFDKYCIFDRKGVWFKPDTDCRRLGKTMTHDNREVAEAITIPFNQPEQALEIAENFDVVVFDEGQFFSDQIVEVARALVARGKIVIVNGLKLTAAGGIFGAMHYLLAYADEIISLKSVCNQCMRIDSATRTKSFDKNNPTVKVGGSSDYYVVCPECDHEKNTKNKTPISDSF